MIRAVSITLACLSTLALAGAGTARAEQRALHLQQIASASSPIYLAQPSNEPNRLYVVEQGGVVRLIDGGVMSAQPFLDLSSRVKSGGEQGLLSIAFDPGYSSNHFFYVDYTDLSGNSRIVRFKSDGTRAILSTAKRLLFVRQPYANHNGGQLQFGPDGKLYVGFGDGGSGGDPQNNGQNLRVKLGKILRTNVQAGRIKWTIAGYGLRNPWRFSFDRKTGDLYIGDVGQDKWEEVDFLARARLPKLFNYGWSVFEARHVFKSSALLNRRAKVIWPVYEYGHVGGNCAIVGGYVYRGAAQPALRGRYLFGDNCTGAVWSLKVRAGKAGTVRREPITVPALTSFGQDAAGELYALSLNGPVYKIT